MTSSYIPSCSFENETVNVGAVFGYNIDLFNALLGDISLNVEFVEFN
jgi:hypothetical protein